MYVVLILLHFDLLTGDRFLRCCDSGTKLSLSGSLPVMLYPLPVLMHEMNDVKYYVQCIHVHVCHVTHCVSCDPVRVSCDLFMCHVTQYVCHVIQCMCHNRPSVCIM